MLGFQSFFRFLYQLVLAKIAIRSIRVKLKSLVKESHPVSTKVKEGGWSRTCSSMLMRKRVKESGKYENIDSQVSVTCN